MKDVAAKVKKFLQSERRELHVKLGVFEGFDLLKASGGIEITRALAEEMQAAGIRVSDGAPHLVEGANNRRIKIEGEPTKKVQGFRVKPSSFKDERFQSLALEINTTVFDEFGEELAILPVQVFGTTALQISGIDADIPANASEEKRQSQILTQFRTPRTTLEAPSGMDAESIIRPSQQSDFGLEVLLKSGNSLSPREARLAERRRAFIDLHRGEEYVVRLHNNANFEVAVELTIDGVNVFQLAENAALKGSKVIIAPNRTAVVPGWFRNLSESNQFKIGAYQESVAKEQMAPLADVGTITATFRA
ncbi:MAG TPA: hypothetical protein DDW52_21950, partial [Planctomycetaceae bacterium]|nr:hypothetical protein [Planctomycetaceae bacterium]